MAKTAEQKAAKTAAKAEKSQLQSAQKAEIAALKSSGASKNEIKNEQKANKVELKSLVTAQKSGTYTPTTNLSEVRSAADTYAGASYAPNVLSLLDSAAKNYTDFNISTVSKRGDVTTGVGLDKLVNYELGKTGDKFNTLMDRAQTYFGKSVTEADLRAAGINIKEDRRNPGVFKSSVGEDGNKDILYFVKNADGTFSGAGANRVRIDAQDGGLFDSTLGKIALAIGAYYLGPLAGQFMGLGTGAISGAVGGGLVGGTASKLGGGDFKTGALLGAGSGFSGAGGFEGLLGTTQAAPITTIDPLTGQVVSTTGTSLGGAAAQGATNLAGTMSEAAFAADDVTQLVKNFGSAAAEQNLVAAGVDPVYAASMVDQAVVGLNSADIASSISNFAGANSIYTGGALTAPITDLSQPFDRAAYDQTAGFGGTLRGVGNLIGAGVGTISSLFGGGGGFGGFGNFGNISSLLNPTTPLTPEQAAAGGYAGASPDYNALIAALGAPRAQPRSLV